jgi:hypothetical protein
MEAINNRELKSFMQSYVSSLIAWAIIVFYHQNPGVRDRVRDLATHLGRKDLDVERAVINLAQNGFLKVEDGAEPIYYYEPDEHLSEQVNVFINALNVRDMRLWMLSEILDK